MATEFISNSWLMPENSNKDRVSNYSLDFAGSAKINYATPVDLGVVSTFSFWMNIDTGTTGVLFGNSVIGANEYVVYYAGSTFYLRIAGAYQNFPNAATAISTGQWHHVAFVRPSENEVKCYIDSVLTDTITSWNGTPGSNPIKFDVIGSRPGSTLPFSGKITEISGFDYALSASQVTELYGTGSAIGNPMAITNGRKPVAYYPLGNAAFNSEFLVPNSAEKDYVFDFNGTNDDQINLSSVISSASEFTLSYWMNPSTFGGLDSYIMGQGATNANLIYNSQVGRLAVKIDGTTLNFNEYAASPSGHSGVNNMASSTWQHMIIIRDSSNDIRVWRNGVAFGDESGYNNSNTFTLDQMGCFVNVYGWEGMLSNVAWWTSDQSANISNIYNNGTPSNLTSLSPVGWWELDASATFDGSNWSIPDASSNSNTGTSSGMTAASLVQSDLIINQSYDPFSLELDGSDDFINCGNAFTQTGAFSVSAWIKTSTTSASSVLYKSGVFQFGKDTWYNGGVGGAPNLSLTDSGGITKLFRNGIAPSGATVTVGTVVNLKDGNWHHIAFTYNGTNQGKYYTDGVVSYTYDITDGSWAGTLASNSNDLLIGKTTVANWNGNLSNISIYSSSLSAAQVTTLYNEHKPFDLNTFAVTPVSWWRLGAVNSSYNTTSSEWTILDEIGTNNGTGSNLGPAQTALTDGVGATGSGLSSGMSSGTNRTGDAPYSDNNAVSYNMSVTAKSTSTPT